MLEIDIIEKLLVKEGIIAEEELIMAKAHLEHSNKTLVEVLNELGFCSELDVLKIINESLGLGYKITSSLDEIFNILDEKKVRESDFNLKSELSIERNQVVLNFNDNDIYILTSVIDDENSINDTKKFYRKMTQKNVEFIATTHYNLILIRKKIYENLDYSQYLKDIMSEKNFSDKLNDSMSYLIEHGVIENASDIYINLNKQRDLSYIYFRIKRNKMFKYVFPTSKLDKLLQHLMQKANMESGRLTGHQDGSVVVQVLNKKYNISLRINSISTIEGNHVTIRLQDEAKKLKDLGFEKEDFLKIKTVLERLKGIIMLVGATGSGKTTTMYAMLNEFNPHKYNIITMEDPVEIRKFGLNQIQISDDGKQSFKDSIRACMRQAPDIILIGEIRDFETAERAIEAANTGHLVLATIHANGVASIADRLKELGVHNTTAFTESISCGIYQELKNNGEEYYLGYEIMTNGNFDNIKKYKLD